MGDGAAGALILILLWGFYSSQILLLGAEITRAIGHGETGDVERKKEVRVGKQERVARPK